MKVMIVGSWAYPMYERAIGEAFSEIGLEVQACSWAPYFSSKLGRAEDKFSLPGPNTLAFNRRLLQEASAQRPDVLLTWRATGILPRTLQELRGAGIHLASYNHDDFTGPSVGAPVPWHHRLHWRLFLAGAGIYHDHFVKRQSNIEHLRSLGSFNNHIAKMWFVPKIHRPVELTAEELQHYGCDVVFAGHYEPDDRVRHLRALVEAGLSVRLFGGAYWNRAVLGDLYDRFAPIRQVEGDEYAKALNGAKLCLAFLSKLNRDTYTRRCFEIPACGRVMLAERTDDLRSMFKEDEEACFFSSPGELLEKATWLVKNPAAREAIALAGLRRVWADGYDARSWARTFLDDLSLSRAR